MLKAPACIVLVLKQRNWGPASLRAPPRQAHWVNLDNKYILFNLKIVFNTLIPTYKFATSLGNLKIMPSSNAWVVLTSLLVCVHDRRLPFHFVAAVGIGFEISGEFYCM